MPAPPPMIRNIESSARSEGDAVLTNVLPVEQLKGIAGRKSKPDEYKSVRNPLVEAVQPMAKLVGKYFANLPPDQVTQFRALRGVQGQTAGTRRVERELQKAGSNFDPPGLKEYIAREKAQTTTQAFEEIRAIESILQNTVLTELKNEFGSGEEDWWFSGVPKSVRKNVDDRRNEEAGKSGGREDSFDLIDYREVITSNWTLFETMFARGKGSKDARTKWLAEVNDLRKPVVHASRGQSLPITEE